MGAGTDEHRFSGDCRVVADRELSSRMLWKPVSTVDGHASAGRSILLGGAVNSPAVAPNSGQAVLGDEADRVLAWLNSLAPILPRVVYSGGDASLRRNRLPNEFRRSRSKG